LKNRASLPSWFIRNTMWQGGYDGLYRQGG
jgi:hypothetical protein